MEELQTYLVLGKPFRRVQIPIVLRTFSYNGKEMLFSLPITTSISQANSYVNMISNCSPVSTSVEGVERVFQVYLSEDLGENHVWVVITCSELVPINIGFDILPKPKVVNAFSET